MKAFFFVCFSTIRLDCITDLTPLLLSSDAHYAAVRADLEADAQDLEAESWSLAVDQQHVKKHSKEAVKRQDVIYGECVFVGLRSHLHLSCSLTSSWSIRCEPSF